MKAVYILAFVAILFTPFFGSAQYINPDTATLRKLKTELENLADKDWHYRQILDSVRIQFGIGSKEYKKVFSLVDSSDKVNQEEIVPILDKYGWLGKSQLGEKANEAIFYIIHHSNNDLRIKYIPLMRESVAKGESNKLHLQWMEDRILSDQDKLTIYKTQPFAVPRKDGSTDFYEIRARANEELKKEGLDTIVAPINH